MMATPIPLFAFSFGAFCFFFPFDFGIPQHHGRLRAGGWCVLWARETNTAVVCEQTTKHHRWSQRAVRCRVAQCTFSSRLILQWGKVVFGHNGLTSDMDPLLSVYLWSWVTQKSFQGASWRKCIMKISSKNTYFLVKNAGAFASDQKHEIFRNLISQQAEVVQTHFFHVFVLWKCIFEGILHFSHFW